MVRRLQNHVSKLIKICRWLIPIVGVLISIATVCLLHSATWSALLSLVGVFLGLGSIWLTLIIFQIGTELSDQQNQIILSQKNLVDEVHKAVMTSLKFQHFNELRRNYFQAKRDNDEEAKVTYDFYWRFETWTSNLVLGLLPKGHASIRVIGTVNPALETDYEKILNPTIYTVDVLDTEKHENLKKGRAYCWCVNGRLFISNEASGIELMGNIVEFRITGRVGSGGAVSMEPDAFPRLMDLQTPSDQRVKRT